MPSTVLRAESTVVHEALDFTRLLRCALAPVDLNSLFHEVGQAATTSKNFRELDRVCKLLSSSSFSHPMKMNATWPVVFAACVLMCKLYLLMLYKFNGCFQVHLTSMGSSSELVLYVPLFYIHYDSVYGTIKLRTDLFICCTIYFHRNVSPGTCNVLIYVNSFLKFISHRSLLDCMWNDVLWLNFCFHDTAPICIPAVAFEAPLLAICVFLLSLMHFFRKLSLKMPVWPLSWRSPSISMCVSKMDLNYSNPIPDLVTGCWCREVKWSGSLCGQSPWQENSCEISWPFSSIVFFTWS